jgi:aspartate dehydrogenase
MAAQPGRRVGLVGCGAIGRVIADSLRRGVVRGSTLAGVLTRTGAPPEFAVATIDELVDRSDIVIEAASQEAVATYGSAVKEAGRDLLVLSIGALVSDELRVRLFEPAGGRVLLSSGAAGGIDILRAAALLGDLELVRLTTTKPSGALIRDWMAPAARAALESGEPRVHVFRGPARDAVRLFPESANLAGLIALATIGFDDVEVEVWGEPDRSVATHRIVARGAAGAYDFTLENALSTTNPRTSAVTAYAVLRHLQDEAAAVVVGC